MAIREQISKVMIWTDYGNQIEIVIWWASKQKPWIITYWLSKNNISLSTRLIYILIVSNWEVLYILVIIVKVRNYSHSFLHKIFLNVLTISVMSTLHLIKNVLSEVKCIIALESKILSQFKPHFMDSKRTKIIQIPH